MCLRTLFIFYYMSILAFFLFLFLSFVLFFFLFLSFFLSLSFFLFLSFFLSFYFFFFLFIYLFILRDTVHSPTFPSLHLRHSSFSKLSVTSPTSQLILQLFRRFTSVTAHSPTPSLLHLRHSSFSNPYFACHMSQALHFRHLASRP